MRAFLATLATLCLTASPAPTQTYPFDDCGTLVPGVTCPILFQDSAGLKWVLSTTGGLPLGSVVRVTGIADPGCITFCMQGGCIFGNTIGPCVTDPSVPFCFGDGSGTACPCGNHTPAGENRGCLHSLGTGGRLTASGTASVGADSVLLLGEHMPDAPALYFQGTSRTAGGAGAVFGDGLRCAGGSVIRLGARTNSGGASYWPGPGDPSVSVRGLLQPGDLRQYQIWFRNAAAFCTAATYNLSNGIEIPWGA